MHRSWVRPWPAAPIALAALLDGTTLVLNWSGGVAPYQVQMTTNTTETLWQNIGAATTATNATMFPTNTAAFYRILGQ